MEFHFHILALPNFEKKVDMDIINLNAALLDDSKWDEGTWGEL
jgi:hypothetical protein